MANLATRADRLRMRIERVARRRLRREFGRFARVASESPRSLERPTLEHRDRIVAILAHAYRLSIRLGVSLTEDQLLEVPPKTLAALARSLIGRMTTSFKQESTEALTERLIADWIENNAFNRARSISNGSRAIAQRILDQSINEGLGERETARNIQQAITGLSRARSLTIARTETQAALQEAGSAAADDLGATTKEWVAIEDDRTRDTHRQADGQTVPIGGKFRVGAAALRHPGDMSAGHPEETINCRCAMAFA